MQQLIQPDGSIIAYNQTPGSSPGVLYLGGFKADMTGTKAMFLEKACQERGQSFLRFDYFGHGASSGDFKEGCLGRWKSDALAVLDELTTGPQILVGSSMGGWLMLLLALARPERIVGLLGLAAAPDFTSDLLHKLKKIYQDALLADGVCYIPSALDDQPYPITMKLIEEGKKHELLANPIPIHCPVRLIHGTHDSDVPWQQSLKLMNALESDDVQMICIKKANHRLSSKANLTIILRVLDSFFQAV